MNITKADNFLKVILENPGKWAHLRRTKRKNNLHDKSDEKSRKKIFEDTCRALQLLNLVYETRNTYFIRLQE